MNEVKLNNVNGYVFFDDAKKFFKYEFVREDIDFEKEIVKTVCRIGGELKELIGNFTVYTDISRSIKAEPTLWSVEEIDKRIKRFKMSNGRAVMCSCAKHPVRFDGCSFSLIDGDYYKTADECYFNSSYTRVNEDGSEETIVGDGVKLKLSDEQLKSVENLKAAFKYLEDSGVIVAYNREDHKLMFVNKIDGMELCYCGDEGPNMRELDDLYVWNSVEKVEAPFDTWWEDDHIYLKNDTK